MSGNENRTCCDTAAGGSHAGTCDNSLMRCGEERFSVNHIAKQVIVVRDDLGMRRGKQISQGAHASMAWLSHRLEPSRHYDGGNEGGAWLEGEVSEAERCWLSGLFTKITVRASSEQALRDVVDAASFHGVIAHLITDAGKTEFHGVPTPTAVAVGPDWSPNVDLVTGHLELY